MKITAVIPAYNSAAYITQALDSIAAQTRPVSEIIVVDDGSTDDTADLVRNWAGPVPLSLVTQKNQGPSAARNRGIRAADGDWIAFLDADDQWTPTKIEEQCAALARHPTLALVASDMAETDSSGKITTPSVLDQHDLLGFFEELDGAPLPDALAALLRKNFIPTGTVLARRSVLLETGPFNPRIRYGEDLELWARIAARHPLTCLPRVHMLRRRHESNATGHEIDMLLDLIEVNRNLAADLAGELKAQGLDPRQGVAQAAWTAGYWYFAKGDHRRARALFWRSLREKPGRRALFHLLLSALPAGWVARARTWRSS